MSRSHRRQWRAAAYAIGFAIAIFLYCGALAAAEGDAATSAADLTAFTSSASEKLADPETSTTELQRLREEAIARRTDAAAAADAIQPDLDDLTARLDALGEAPGDGVAEAPEAATLRTELTNEISERRSAIAAFRDSQSQATDLVRSIDAELRTRFAAELLTRGSSPLGLDRWSASIAEIRSRSAIYQTNVGATIGAPGDRRSFFESLALNALLAGAALVIVIILQHRLGAWAENWLGRRVSPRVGVWLLALRNLARLIVPVVGVGLAFGALDRSGLLGATGTERVFFLPPFAIALIAAIWIGLSLFAPQRGRFRLLPVSDGEARLGMWLSLQLGLVVALQRILRDTASALELTPATVSTLFFPIIVIGSLGLWATRRMLLTVQSRLAERNADAQTDETPGASIGLNLLGALPNLLLAAAILAPVLAAFGFLAAARFLIVPVILTLGILGAGIVLFDLLEKTLGSVIPARADAPERGRLLPVLLVMLLSLAAAPLLALAWGAEPANLYEFWLVVAGGFSIGGVQISLTTIGVLIIVLAIGLSLTRLAGFFLRRSILPRTRLDAGARNAMLQGIRYVGMILTGFFAISATGIDLSNIAIVAGAFSVGIGFGLQNIVSNFVSGVILLIERPIKEGDWIEVGGYEGYVRDISVRSTEIETFDRASVILPNSSLVAGTVLNRTHSGRTGRINIAIVVPYENDAGKVISVLKEIAAGNAMVSQQPAPHVLVTDVATTGLGFELRVWLRDVSGTDAVRSDLNSAILQRFRAEGMLPAYPAPPPAATPAS